MSRIKIVFVVLLLVTSVQAQSKSKPRVFVNDSQSWEVTGKVGGANDGFGGSVQGGARPQTAEIVKTFAERCPGVILTMKQERADYIVTLDHEGGKDLLRRDNKFAVFNSDGDAIKSGSTRSLGNAVKNVCEAIIKDGQNGESQLN
jgi:hypothetical protein